MEKNKPHSKDHQNREYGVNQEEKKNLYTKYKKRELYAHQLLFRIYIYN